MAVSGVSQLAEVVLSFLCMTLIHRQKSCKALRLKDDQKDIATFFAHEFDEILHYFIRFCNRRVQIFFIRFLKDVWKY